MHHDPEQVWIGAKALAVAAVTGTSIVAAAVFAQVERIIPNPTSDSTISFILATGMVALLSSVVYIFRENIARAHTLELEKQITDRERVKYEAETEQTRMKLEAERTKEERAGRQEREERIMNLLMISNRNLVEAQADISRMREKLLYTAERSDAIEGDHESITDSSMRRKFVNPQEGHG